MRIPAAFFVLLLFLLSAFSCHKNAAEDTKMRGPADSGEEIAVAAETDSAGEKKRAVYDLAVRIASALDDRQLAGQVIISGIDGRGQLTQDMRILLTECPAGGIMLFRYNLDAANDAIRDLINENVTLIESGAAVELPEKTVTAVTPFIAVDHEGETVNRFRKGVSYLPNASSYWEMSGDKGVNAAFAQITADSYYAGKVIKDLGVNLNFAPVAEYLNENNSVFLQERSYGSDPAFVADASAAFIAGMELAGLLCAVKHFPGSAGSDPHFFPSVLSGDRTALAELIAPFESLIRDGCVRAVMVAHTSVPERDSANIASLSPAVMDEWLRQELGFGGIIICDDFSMEAAGNTAENLRPQTAAVRSLAAGADMVLVWPPDLRRTHREIQAALNDGRLSHERLREAASRIIFEKIQTGLINGE